MHADRFAVLAQQPVQDRASGQASLLEAPAAGWLIHCVREARQTAAACGEDLVLVATTLAHCTATTFLMMLMLDGRMHGCGGRLGIELSSQLSLSGRQVEEVAAAGGR
jgi:hypothetical protein